jgi:ketosteroid isomerase-like protein
MSQENVEIVRTAWDAWLRRDLDTLLASYIHPEVVFDMTHFRDWPDRMYRGREGFARFLAEWLETWEPFDDGVDEVLAAPDGRVVVLTWQRGTGRRSGLPMGFEWAQITTVHGGKITRLDGYDDRSKALEAAGLRE